MHSGLHIRPPIRRCPTLIRGKFLYASISGQATITRLGRVQFSAIPADLRQVVSDHLPESAASLTDLNAGHPQADIDLLRQILLDCSRGIGETGTGLDQVTVMVHNQASTVSIRQLLLIWSSWMATANPTNTGT